MNRSTALYLFRFQLKAVTDLLSLLWYVFSNSNLHCHWDFFENCREVTSVCLPFLIPSVVIELYIYCLVVSAPLLVVSAPLI